MAVTHHYKNKWRSSSCTPFYPSNPYEVQETCKETTSTLLPSRKVFIEVIPQSLYPLATMCCIFSTVLFPINKALIFSNNIERPSIMIFIVVHTVAYNRCILHSRFVLLSICVHRKIRGASLAHTQLRIMWTFSNPTVCYKRFVKEEFRHTKFEKEY